MLNAKDMIKQVDQFGYMKFLRTSLNAGGAISDIKDDNFLQNFKKDDEVLVSSTTGVRNILYGATVWNWTNLDNPTWGALAKRPWDKSGERIKTADSTVKIAGLDETEALPAAYKPTYASMSYPLRQMVSPMHFSRKATLLSGKDDTQVVPEQLRKDRGMEHASGLNEAILADAQAAAGAADANYLGGKVFESLDRLLSCDAEEDDLGGSYTSWYDPYDGSSYDRDSGTTYDSVVVHGDGTVCYQGGNPDFTTDATFTLSAVDTLIDTCLDNGAKRSNLFFVTGRDTLTRWKNLEAPKQRYMNPVYASMDVNGIRTENGVNAGFRINSYDDIPIIVDPDCPSDTISKIFLVDREHVFLKMMTPTIYVPLGMPAFSTISSTLAPRLGEGAFFLTEGELAVTRFNTSGKLCALK